MRIGIDARLWNESGVGRYIRNLVEQLQEIDKKNKYVLFLRKPEFDTLTFAQKNIETRLADIRWHSIAEQVRFPGILLREKLDLVHFPYFSVPILYSRPFVITIHDLILHHFATGEASTLPYSFYRAKLSGYKFIINNASKRARKIITVTKTTKKEIVEHLHIEPVKIAVTYEGVDDHISGEEKITKAFYKNYFLYVGNAYPHKNLARLLKAFEIVSHKHQDILLVFVGKQDAFYEKVKQMVLQMNLSRAVIFRHDVTDEDLRGLYRHALALVMPSVMEGFGLPVIEAMANKCTVIVSNIPSLKELCGDTALYFNPENIQDIAAMLEKVLQGDTHIHALNEKAYERTKQFSWERMAQETVAVYESCIRL